MDRSFGTRIEALPKDAAVWIVASSGNSPAATKRWEATGQDTTTFREQAFADILSTVDLHHPDWCELEVHGEGPSASALEALGAFGPGNVSPTADGFVFIRRNA
jgi:hypothetical protein